MNIFKYQQFNEAEKPLTDARSSLLAKRALLNKEKKERARSFLGNIDILNNSEDFRRMGVRLVPNEFKNLDQNLRIIFSDLFRISTKDSLIFKLDISNKKFDFDYTNLEVELVVLKVGDSEYKLFLFDNAKNFQQYKEKKDRVGEKAILNSIMGMVVDYVNFRTKISKKISSLKIKFEKVLGKQSIIDNFANLFDMCDSHQIEQITFPDTVKIKLLFVSSQFKLGGTYYKKVNKKYVGIIDELIVISERMADEGVSVYYQQMPGGVHILLKLDDVNDLLRIKKKKIEPGAIPLDDEDINESIIDPLLNRILGNTAQKIVSEILTLNDSPEFKKEKVSIQSTEDGGTSQTTKFRIMWGKSYTPIRTSRGPSNVIRPTSFNIVKPSPSFKNYNVVYNYNQMHTYRDIRPNINKSGVPIDEIKEIVKTGILYASGLSNENQLKIKKYLKASESRKRTVDRKKTNFVDKISKQFVLDEFSNIFDFCKSYTVNEPVFNSSLGGFIIHINLNPTISTFRLSRKDYTKVDNSFIDFYSELMTTSERIAEQGIEMSITSDEDGSFKIMINMKKKDVSKKI